MGPIVAATIAAFVAAAGLALYRLKRGWETWGDLAQMAVALAVVGGIMSSVDNGIREGLIGAVMWSAGGTLFFWMERPSKPIVTPPLEPQTEDQRRLSRRLERSVAFGTVVLGLASFAASALYFFDLLTWGWIAILLIAVALVVIATWRISKALTESGTPYHRGLLRFPRPTRW